MLILKSQQFKDIELLEFAQKLSQVEGPIEEKLLHWDFGPIMTMSYNPEATNYLFSAEKVPFHWDGAFFREPRLLLFYCIESEGTGGETLFSNTEKIWLDLSPEEKELCSNITLKFCTEKLAHYGGEITVPLVQNHPSNGQKILRLAERVETAKNPVSLEVLGLTNGEEIYQNLILKLYQEKYLYEHSWNEGDLIVCDNYTYLHGRRDLQNNKKRRFKRIQIL